MSRAMTDTEFKSVMDHFGATWPKTKLNPKTTEAWYSSMSDFTALHCYQAIERLAQSQELMPMLSQFRRMAMVVRDELQDSAKPIVDPKVDPKNYPTSPYLKEAKRLIRGEAATTLLMTATERLDVEGAGIKAKVIDCAVRHRKMLEEGRAPDGVALMEVHNLASAADDWWKKNREARQREHRRLLDQQEKRQAARLSQ